MGIQLCDIRGADARCQEKKEEAQGKGEGTLARALGEDSRNTDGRDAIEEVRVLGTTCRDHTTSGPPSSPVRPRVPGLHNTFRFPAHFSALQAPPY